MSVKLPSLRSLTAVGILVFTSNLSWAAATKSYQVTGPVLEVTDTSIVVKKGKEKWELSRGAATKVTGDLKVGSKVTVGYTMDASEIQVKDATAPKEKKK